MRTAKAHACSFEYVVSGFLNGAGELWQPNQLVEVRDRFAGVFGTMLISAVTWSVSDEGNFTHLSLVPPDAFDLTGSLINPPKGQVKLPRRR